MHKTAVASPAMGHWGTCSPMLHSVAIKVGRQSLMSNVLRILRTTVIKISLLFISLRERLGVDDIALVLQQNRLRWYGHVL